MAIFSLTNCTKKNLVPEADSSYFSIFANFEQTRTSADAFGKASWVDGDAINVYFKSGSEYVNCGKYVIEDALTGKFVGKLTDEIRGKLGETNDWYFYYPYSEDRKSPESTDAEEGWVVGCDANVPLVQSTINDMSHLDGKNFPLYGITKGVAKDATPSATMKHIASLLAIGIRNEYSQDIDILRVEFNTQNNYIAGKFSVDFSQEPLVFTPKECSKSLSLIVSNGTIATGSTAYFYVPIIPFEINTEEHVKLIAYAENGICSRLKDIDNARFDSGNIHLVKAKYSEESDVLKEEAKLRYEKVTSMPTELGTYILVDESSLSVWDGKKTEINYTPIRSISDMIISPVYQRAELNIRPLGEGNYSIKLVNTGFISGIENSISIGNEPVANAISINDGKVSISSNGTYLVFNPATNSFAYYDSSIAENCNKLSLYKKQVDYVDSPDAFNDWDDDEDSINF